MNAAQYIPVYPIRLPTDPTYPYFDIDVYADGSAAVVALHWSRGELASQAVIATLGLLSTLSVASLLLYLLASLLRKGTGTRVEINRSVRAFLTTDLGALFLCLLITDFMSSVGFATNYHFVAQGLSTIGSACSFQATMYIVAIVAVGYWNVCIAAQTFSVLVLRVKTPRWLLVLVITLGWSAALACVMIGPISHAIYSLPYPLYGPTAVGCFTSSGSPPNNTILRAAPILVLVYVVATFVLYIAIAVHVARVLKADSPGQKFTWSRGRLPWSSKSQSRSTSNPTSTVRSVRLTTANSASGVAAKMLWFPACYALATLPTIIVDSWAAWTLSIPKTSILQMTSAFSACIGLLDVILFVFTRRSLVFGSPTRSQTAQNASSHVQTHLSANRHLSNFPQSSFSSPDMELMDRVDLCDSEKGLHLDSPFIASAAKGDDPRGGVHVDVHTLVWTETRVSGTGTSVNGSSVKGDEESAEEGTQMQGSRVALL